MGNNMRMFGGGRSEDVWDWRGQDIAGSRGVTIDKIRLRRQRE